jgi:hypothetical protein
MTNRKQPTAVKDKPREGDPEQFKRFLEAARKAEAEETEKRRGSGVRAGSAPESEELITRLGNVIYWTGCALAIVWIGFSLFASGYEPRWGIWVEVGLGGAAMIWVLGRSIKYVLSGT